MGEITVCVSTTNHDRSVTILEDGKLKNILIEDRFSRIKNDEKYPMLSVFLLSNLIKKIDYLVIANDWEITSEHIRDTIEKNKIEIKNFIILDQKYHHLYHTASAFYSSGFKEAICLTIDGFGGSIELPNTSNLKGRFTTTISTASYPSNIEMKYANIWYDPVYDQKFQIPKDEKIYDYNSNPDIGIIYHATCSFLGFPHISDAGKVMGLAPYGKKDPLIPDILYKDTIYGNSNLIKADGEINTKLNPYIENLTKEKAIDFAYAVQEALNKIFIKRVEQALSYSNSKNLVLSGGCFLNVIGNYILQKHFPDINFYIDPIANDSSQSYGAAKWFYHKTSKSNKINPLKDLYWGPSYSKENLLNSIKKYA